MVFVDLTESFLSFRRQFRQSQTNLNALFEDDKKPQPSVSPDWLLFAEECDNIVEKAEANIKKLKDAQTKALKAAKLASTASNLEVGELTNKITRQLRKAQSVVKRIANKPNELSESSAESKVIRLNLMRQKGNRLQNLNAEFRELEQSYVRKLAASRESSGAFEEAEITSLFESEELTQLFEHGTHDEVQKEAISAALANVEQLSALFSDMQVLVVEQGSVLDRIDFQLGTAVETADAGYHELSKTANLLDNRRTKRVVRWLLFVLLVLFVLNIIKLRRHK